MKRYSVKYILPVVLWMAVIFLSSSIPSEFFPRVEFWGWAKLVHVLYYGLLALLVERAIRHQEKSHLLWRYVQIASILFAVLYGATDEIHQLFTAGRHARVTDVLIDGFGASLFIGASMVYRSLVPKRVQSEG
jgi:VanZ family protein